MNRNAANHEETKYVQNRFCLRSLFLFILFMTCSIHAGQAEVEGRVKHRFLVAGWKSGGVELFDADGIPQWEITSPDEISDAWLLPDGGVVQSFSRRRQKEAGVIRYDSSRKMVWEYRCEPDRDNHSCQPLPGGGFLLGESAKDGLWMVELNASGKESKRVKVGDSTKDHHHAFRQVRKTPEGTYLGTVMKENKTYEWDAAGNLIRTFPQGIYVAIRLPDGHTLVSGKERVVEYDGKGSAVWKLTSEDLPFGLNFNCGLQRLPNGNTVVGTCWHGKHTDKEAPMVFEVTPDKEIVWEVYSSGGNMGNIQVLDIEGVALR